MRDLATTAATATSSSTAAISPVTVVIMVALLTNSSPAPETSTAVSAAALPAAASIGKVRNQSDHNEHPKKGNDDCNELSCLELTPHREQGDDQTAQSEFQR